MSIVAAGCRHLPNFGKQKRAIDACKAALDAYPSDAGPRDEHVDLNRVVFRHCAAMVRDDGCRSAFEWAAMQNGLEAIGTALAGCRRSYCTGEISIDACEHAEFATRQEETAAWGQILGLVFARDAGSDAPAIAKSFLNAGGRMPPPPPMPHMITLPPSSEDLRLDVAADGTATLTAGDGGVIASLPTAQLSSFLTGRRDLIERSFTVAAAPGVDYQVLIRAIDALNQAGVHDFRFGVPR
jgi:hypothetical protein